MPSFDPASVVDPMRFRLKPDDEYRTIPEPSTLQVQAYVNAQRTEIDRMEKETATAEGEDLEAALKRLGPAQVKAARKRSAKIHADLCSGVPSAEELEQAPHRVFTGFANWIAEEILNPEAVTGAGNAQVIPLPSAAAG